MFATVVRFPAPLNGDGVPPTLDQARAMFAESAPHYLKVPGLLWKGYVLAADASTVGGIYWWTDRAAAEAAFDDDWHTMVTARYGAPPTIDRYEMPIVVDPRFDMIRTTPPIGGAAEAKTESEPDPG